MKKLTNFDGIKNGFNGRIWGKQIYVLDETEIKSYNDIVKSKRQKRLQRRIFTKYFIIGFIVGLGVLIILNEMLGNPIYQYFLNK
jgi:hypothetical protein